MQVRFDQRRCNQMTVSVTLSVSGEPTRVAFPSRDDSVNETVTDLNVDCLTG
jgi:hypothetical protein